MHRYKELKVWQKAIDLAVEVYKITAELPKDEKFGLTSQMNRSAVSIPSNIAEGAGRNSGKDFNNFLGIALGSSFELDTQVVISYQLEYISKESFQHIENEIKHLQNMLAKLKMKINS